MEYAEVPVHGADARPSPLRASTEVEGASVCKRSRRAEWSRYAGRGNTSDWVWVMEGLVLATGPEEAVLVMPWELMGILLVLLVAL